MPRRVELARAANERYLEALAVVDVPSPTRNLLDPASRRPPVRGRPYRPLRPIRREDADVFRVVLRGEFNGQGSRNKDLRRGLIPTLARDSVHRRKESARISRWLRLLRTHGLIAKISGTRYRRVTPRGHHVMSAALSVRESDVTQWAA